MAVQNRFELRWTLLLLVIWSKNDRWIASRMIAEFEHPQDSSSSDYERWSGKEKVVCTLCSTLFDTWAKGKSSNILPRHYRDGRCRQNFFNNIITGDENWCFAYDPETKWQSPEWVGETSPRPKKLKFQWSRIKIMLINFTFIVPCIIVIL